MPIYCSVSHLIGTIVATGGVAAGAAVPGGNAGADTVRAIKIGRGSSRECGDHVRRVRGEIECHYGGATASDKERISIGGQLQSVGPRQWIHAIGAGRTTLCAGKSTEPSMGSESGEERRERIKEAAVSAAKTSEHIGGAGSCRVANGAETRNDRGDNRERIGIRRRNRH